MTIYLSRLWWTTREAASYNFAFFHQSFHFGRYNANRVFISDYVSPRVAS